MDLSVSCRAAYPAGRGPNTVAPERVVEVRRDVISRKLIVLLSVLLIALGSDQAVKSIVRAWPVGADATWVPGLLRTVHVENPGAAMGLLGDWPLPVRLAIFGVAALGLGFVVVRWVRALPAGAVIAPAALGAVVGGALGNFVDRAVRGSVTDWVVPGEAVFGPLSSMIPFVSGVPAINGADVWLGLGLVVLTVSLGFSMFKAGQQVSPDA